MSITKDLSKFGKREFDLAIKFLECLRDAKVDDGVELGNDLQLNFNRNTGDIFLEDEDCNVYCYDSSTDSIFLYEEEEC